jgi:AAA+ ATPase superfamily predicted ATPase
MLFIYGRTVSGKQFYDRSNMQKAVRSHLKSAQSFMLKAPRRFGKTSLIKHVMLQDSIDYLYLDFRKTPRLELINNQIIEYIYSRMGISGALKQIKENVLAFLRTHKTKITARYEWFEASVEFFSNNSNTDADKLVFALDMLPELSAYLNRPIYIFMDEYQDVKNLSKEYDITELMRGAMQHHENVCYIFAGSNTTLMTQIFENKKSPFFNATRKLKLEAFNIEELTEEIINAFKTKNISFKNKYDLIQLLIRLKGHPANTILVMEILEQYTEREKITVIQNQHCTNAYNEALEEIDDLITEYLKEIKSKEHLHDVIYRIANKEEQTLEPSSLLQKKKTLVELGYLSHIGRGEYQIIDSFLEDNLH